ncbi:EAL domain-containing protein [Ahrensia sp. R2A130]|nr:EAL domain-containing protein [Ahrensia sp. R2A130]
MSSINRFESLCRFHGEPRRTPDLWFAEAAEVGLGVDLEIVFIERALEALSTLREDIRLSLNA